MFSTRCATAVRSCRRSSRLLDICRREFAGIRRQRPRALATRYKDIPKPQEPDRGGLQHAFQPQGDNFESYLAKASLSPWVPVPDPVARKMLELAKAGPEDIHLELGSGDGRMNFHAHDPPFEVKKSTGLDIDEQLVASALERLGKRHPRPTNLDFRVQDLLEAEAWHDDAKEATIITMYFVQDALKTLRPILEQAIGDRQVRIVCCGYSMPGWEPRTVETILDLPLYLYTYNTPLEEYPTLTPEEISQMQAIKQQEDLDPLYPANSMDDGVEQIILPPWDPEEEIDGHWDDFDDDDDVPVEEELVEKPAMTKWKMPTK